MSTASRDKNNKDRYQLLNPLPIHFKQIQQLCKKVYPFYRPWNFDELESHRTYFPDGQLIVIDRQTETVVGLAFSLIISWNDYSPQDSWLDYTAGGFFHNHDPKHGKTLYGAEVMVDPDCRGRGIGKLLYEGRRQIVKNYGLKRIRAGARIRGYCKYKDTLSPQEYVRKVVNREFFDPTLSFQLGQGFKVIDVASNYILNDPESLGFAAVIEWLNPDEVTKPEIAKQERAVRRFLEKEKFNSEYLPKELRRLVRRATSKLGFVVREIEGDKFFRKIESYRENLKKTRTSEQKYLELKKLYQKVSRETPQDQLKLAHAFSLQLEIVNACEAAYRTWKLRQKTTPTGLKSSIDLTYVLTAHPTEARSKDVIEILNRIQDILLESVHNKFIQNEPELDSLMRYLWTLPLAKSKKPSVEDEAEYIFSTVFEKDVFDYLLDEKPGYNLRLRTWVGGDKDGHPGVNQKVMKNCLEISRSYLLTILSHKLEQLNDEFTLLAKQNKKYSITSRQLFQFKNNLGILKKITKGDGTKLKVWIKKFKQFHGKSDLIFRNNHEVKRILKLLELFPALVLPIELREDSQLIKQALSQKDTPIRKMILELENISGATDITNYVRGLVISHCETPLDIDNACKLVDIICPKKTLPIIPLFETRSTLKNSGKILTEWLKSKRNHDRVTRFWQKKFEVMLGYSDSSKEIGVLSSRLLIASSMQSIDSVLRKNLLIPIFFHGSGGSIERGGGSIKDQISWWSHSAIKSPKMTIQGEMIQRLFSSKEIINSQCSHMTRESLRRNTQKIKYKNNKSLEMFSQLVEAEYHKLIKNQELLQELLKASPYNYLDVLKIGSRPSKRPSANIDLSSLRAIPWVLCWTQTRTLLPSWWGVGTAWIKLGEVEKNNIRQSFQNDKFLASYVRTLGFTLEKVELDVWNLYFDKNSKIPLDQFKQELAAAKKFVLEITQENDLLSHLPWLKDSIYLRSPHIHLLNILQVIAINKSDENLLRETIVGIACGMMTTG